jgi:tetratricopeptide (TPR) repeat protein
LPEALALYQELHDESPQNFTYLGRLGTIAARSGDRDEASRIDQELAAMDGPYVFGRALRWRALIAAVLGDADRAVGLLQQSYEAGGSYGLWIHRDPDLAVIAGHPGFEELRRPKG